ncbi:MAG: response regulator, partial [Anaerolineae bacterium]|nr:response regulator [Anaerolineae bacterium]
LRLVHQILQAEGAEVVEAVDGRQALELYEKEHPDLIILDIIIPHIDGIRVLKRIREQDEITGIIMVSALSSERLTIECMQSGADDYLNKPFPLKEARSRIKQVLEKTQLRRRNAELQAQVAELNERLRVLIGHYMPQQVTQRLLREPGSPRLGGTRQVVTVLFADLRDFTPLAESLPPDELINVLNVHLSALADAALAYEGMVDKFMGDGAMILFNAPIPQPDHVERAVRAALDMKRAISELTVLPEGRRLTLSIGIHVGEAVVGNIGSQELMNYTAIGDTVVLAKRLQETAESGQILVSEDVCRRIHRDFIVEDVGILTVKGRVEPVHAYSVLGIKE